MIKIKIILLPIFILGFNMLIAQTFSDINNYGLFSVKDGAKIYFKSFYNNGSGSFQFTGTMGEMHLTGDWQNNSSDTVSMGTTNGTVFFDGNSLQTIDYTTKLTEFANLTVSSAANVQVPVGKFITIKGNYTNSGTFTLKSDSTGTASLLDGNVFGSVSNTGNIKVERYLTANGSNPYYHYVSSPVADADFESIWDKSLGNYWVWWYDETVVDGDLDQGWKRFVKEDEPYIRGRGYTGIYTASTVRVFDGPLQTSSDISIPVTWTETVLPWKSGDPRGWVLLGNPYPSPVSALDFLTTNSDGTTAHPLTGTMYFWDDEDGDISRTSDYASWNKTGGIGTAAPGHAGYSPNDTIAIGQGFFVQYDKNIGTGDNRSALVYFKNSMRRHNIGSQFFIPDLVVNQKLILSVTSENENYNEILIGFMEGASWSFDRLYDGVKLKGNPYIALYTDMSDGQYGITALPLPTISDSIPLGLDANDSVGMYIFKAESIENFNNMKVLLEDRVMKISTDLSQGLTYHVFLPAGIYQNRFYLRFEEIISTLETQKLDMKVIVNGNDLMINLGNKHQSETEVIICDIIGKQIYHGNFTGNSTIIHLNDAKGYYLVRLLSANLQYNQKVLFP